MFTITVIAVFVLLVYWLLKRLNDDALSLVVENPPRLSGRLLGFPVLASMVLAYVVYFSVFSIFRHLAFKTNGADLGIFDQLLSNIWNRGSFQTTLCGDHEMNFLANHVSFIHFLLAPIYALHQDATTLLVLQSLLLGLGAISVYLLAKDRLRGHWPPLVLSAAYLLYPVLHGVNRNDFHEMAIVTPLLLCALLFLERGQTCRFLVAFFLVISVKEDVALSCMAVGLYALFVLKKRRLGLATAGFALLYFVLCVKVVIPHFGGAPMVDRFEGYIAPGMEGLSGLLMTFLSNPFYTLKFVFFDELKILFLLQVFVPVLFLPLRTRWSLILMAPALATSLLASDTRQYLIGFHYPGVMVPFVFYLTIKALSEIQPTTRNRLLVILLLATVLCNYEFGLIASKRMDGFEKPDGELSMLESIMKEVSEDASLSASNPLIPHVSGRAHIYYFPLVEPVDYVLFLRRDMPNSYWPVSKEEAYEAIIEVLEGEDFGVVDRQGDFLLLKRGADKSRNGKALNWVREGNSHRYTG